MLAAAITACASHPWWYQSGISSCGPIAQVHVRHQILSTGCSGTLEDPPTLSATLHVGETLAVHITTDTDGRPSVPLPQAANPRVMRRVDSSDMGATANYRAIAPGTTELVTRTIFCLNPAHPTQEPTLCPVVRVIVRP